LEYLYGKRLAQKQPQPLGRRVTGWERVRVQKQAVEGNDPHGGHWQVYEGGRAGVGVRYGMVEVKLLCFRGLFTFLKLV
jgi:hypothetical protein